MKRMFSDLWRVATFVLSLLLPFIVKALIKWNVRILDLFFLSLILVLFWCVIVVALGLNKHAKHEPRPASRKKLRFNNEILFVMSRVATQVPNNAAEVEMKRKTLEESFSAFFKGKGLREFNGLMSELAVRGFFDTTRHVHPDVYCIITDDGFEYLHKHLKKRRWAKELLEMG